MQSSTPLIGADVASLEWSRYSRRQREAEKLEAMLRKIPEVTHDYGGE